MSNANNRLLLLVHTHTQAAALMGCVPHIKANYGFCWVVYSPAILSDPATVEKDFDEQIKALTEAARACYAREDGAGGDAYKVKRDAAILDKSAKVKEAWKAMTKEEQNAAEERIFKEFWTQLQHPPNHLCTVSKHADHFETAAHVEFQNALKAGMKPGYQPGDYVVAWPTSLPKGDTRFAEKAGQFDGPPPTAAERIQNPLPPEIERTAKMVNATQEPKIDKRKGPRKVEPRLRELMQMHLDMLGPIAFELGVKHNDPIMGNRMKLVHHVFALEKARADKEIAAM